MQNKIEMKWKIKKCYDGRLVYIDELRDKYYIMLEIIDVGAEDAANIYQEYWDDWTIADQLNWNREDYIFYLAKWGKAQKEVGRCLYWETREDAQFAIDQLEAKLILDKITK